MIKKHADFFFKIWTIQGSIMKKIKVSRTDTDLAAECLCPVAGPPDYSSNTLDYQVTLRTVLSLVTRNTPVPGDKSRF